MTDRYIKRGLMCILLLNLSLLYAGTGQSVFKNFITARGDQLFDGERPYRFISYNIPNLLAVEDNMRFEETSAWRLPDSYEIRDALETIRLVGGKAARTYVITVKRDSDKPGTIKYVEGPGRFNERAFMTLDTVLAIANQTGVRLIIPFVDNWKWMGGRPQYAAFRGKDQDAFWTDEQIRADFKKTIEYVLNRENTVTATAYKDDKAVLAWELGNELRAVPPEWVAEMAAYVKSIDKNHLVNDGIQSATIPDWLLHMPEVDILSTHHYEGHPDGMLEHIRTSADKARGKKPYYIGEFGFISTSGIRAVLDLVQADRAVSAAMIWSLRFHNRDGGFYWHSEPMGSGLYKAYHWPGFASGHAYDEKNLMALLRGRAFSIDDQTEPPLEIPRPPVLLPIQNVAHISWQGSAGARSYSIERSLNPAGPWQVVADNISDAAVAYAPLYNDSMAKPGQSYYYRVRAVNGAGQSAPSNIIGPVQVQHHTLVDELSNLGVLYHFKNFVQLESGSARRFKEDFHRLKGKKGTELIYRVNGSIQGITIHSFSSDNKPDLELLLSVDGADYKAIQADVRNYFGGELDYGYAYPITLSAAVTQKGFTFLKIRFSDEGRLGRIEVQYGD